MQEYIGISKIFNADGQKICPVKPGSNWRHQAKERISMNPLVKYCECLQNKDLDGLMELFADKFVFDTIRLRERRVEKCSSGC